MNVPVARPQVAAFVAAVRTELDDLSPDEVDELTDGLEADLHDTLAESGASPAEQFGDPAAYAAELRSAAGLPPRAVSGGGRHGAVEGLRVRWDDFSGTVRARPWWPAVRDFTVTLRPVWWVARAGAAALIVGAVLRTAPLIPFLPFVVVSVELGRRGLAGRTRSWRALIGLGNVVATVALLAFLATGVPQRGGPYETMVIPPQNGVWVDGREVRNIFPYDSEGRSLTGVQLYDENGRPLAVGDSARTPLYDDQGRPVAQVPAVDAAGEQRWNAYPLLQRTDSLADQTGATMPGSPTAAALPQVSPGPLLLPSPGAAPAPTELSPTPTGGSPAPTLAAPTLAAPTPTLAAKTPSGATWAPTQVVPTPAGTPPVAPAAPSTPKASGVG